MQLTSVQCLLNGLRLMVAKGGPSSTTSTTKEEDEENNNDNNSHSALAVANILRRKLNEKQELLHAGEMFNEKPKKGVREFCIIKKSLKCLHLLH